MDGIFRTPLPLESSKDWTCVRRVPIPVTHQVR